MKGYFGGVGRCPSGHLLGGENSGNRLQVGQNLDILPIRDDLFSEFDNRSADLYHQPTTRFQHTVSFRNQSVNDVHAGFARKHCVPGFKFADFKLHLVFFR